MPVQKNITLCGVKHAGKTSAAKALSELTGIPYVDSDDALQKLYSEETGMDLSVREIYLKLGEESFRKLEVRALRKIFSDEQRIIALGGGVLSNPFLEKQDRISMGLLCCLDVKDEVAYQRILAGGLPPFLMGKNDPFAALCEMNMARRSVFLERADLIIKIDNDAESTPEKTAEKILSVYKEIQK